MAPKKKKTAAKPKNQKEAILQNAQNAIQERLKTTQQSPSKPDAPKPIEAIEPADSDSSDDEDFNPDVQPVEAESSSSEDEAETAKPGAKKQKAKRKRDDDEVDAELASGDEGIIKERTSKRHKKSREEEFLSDGEGGEAGFIKTRAQRRTEYDSRNELRLNHDANYLQTTGETTAHTDRQRDCRCRCHLGKARSFTHWKTPGTT